jgi:hypothetical protein
VDVDSKHAFSNRLYIKINNVVFIVISISLNCTVPLAKRIVSSLVLVDLPNRSILPRHKNSSSIDVAGIFEPVSTGLCSTFPGAYSPALLILEGYTNAIIKAVGLVVLTADTDDVQVVLAILEYGVPKRVYVIENKRPH